MVVSVPRRQVLTEKMTPYTNLGEMESKRKAVFWTGMSDTVKNLTSGVSSVAKIGKAENDTKSALEKPEVLETKSRADSEIQNFNYENKNQWGNPEYEQKLRDFTATTYSKYRQDKNWTNTNLTDYDEYQLKLTDTLIESNNRGAFQQKIKDAEASAQNIFQQSKDSAAMYGMNSDLDGFLQDRSKKRKALESFGSVAMSPAQMEKELYEFDTESNSAFMNSLAETNPEAALGLLNDERFANQMFGGDVVKNAVSKNKRNQEVSQIETLRQERDSLKEQLKQEGLSKTKQDELNKKVAEYDAAESDILNPNRPSIDWESDKEASNKWAKETEEELNKSKDKTRRNIDPIVKKAIGNMKLNATKQKNLQEMSDFQKFMDNPNQQSIDNDMSSARYYTDSRFKTLTDKKQEYLDNISDVNPNPESSPNATNNILEMTKTLSVLSEPESGDPYDLIEATMTDLTNMKKSGKVSDKDFAQVSKLAQDMLYDKQYRKQVNFLVENATGYYQDSSWLGRLINRSDTRKDIDLIEKESKITQREAFFEAVSMLDTKDPDSILKASAVYKSNMDMDYENKLKFVGVDIRDLETKKQNKQPAFFVLNGSIMEYIGKDSNGNLLGKDARNNRSEEYIKWVKSRTGE